MGRMIALNTTNEVTTGTGLKWKYFVYGAERELSITPNATQQPGSNSVNTSTIIGLEQAEYYLYDHLGNTRISFMPISKAVGQPLQVLVNNAIDYYPYGKVLREYRYGDEAKYMTTQHERDQETGLDYRGARYYDSDIARFLSVDPWAKKYTAWSTYNYVMGNPVMLVDPTGRGPEDWISKEGSNVWEYDSRVKSEKEAINLYGEGTSYKANGGTYDGEVGAKSVGLITLHEGGLQTWDGGSYQNVDNNPFNTPLFLSTVSYDPEVTAESIRNQMIDQAWNNGRYDLVLRYYMNGADNYMNSNKGAKAVANGFNYAGILTSFVLTPCGAALCGFADLIETNIDFATDNPYIGRNLLIRGFSFRLGGVAEGVINDKIPPGLKKDFIEGSINGAAESIENELTK